MLKKTVSKAAASEDPEAYPQGYVEGLNDARTPLAGFFSILPYQIRLRNSTDRGGSVTASEWGIPWEGTALL
jgi:hypothetical protein